MTRNITNELQLAVIQTGSLVSLLKKEVILHFEAITECTIHYKRMVRYTDGVKQFSRAVAWV